MQKILLFTISLLILSCQAEQTQKVESTSENTDQQSLKNTNQSQVGRANYAVIWTWTTDDSDLVSKHLPNISTELTNLWKKDIIENTYFDIDSPTDKLADFANITFFLKAHSITEAQSILDQLIVVKENIASYQLHPVGLLWLDRETEVIREKGITKSFATVWTTTTKSEISDELRLAQNDKVLELWKAGTIENVYFDIEGTQKENTKTDFVFFVNANTEEEANAICHALPFYSNNIATYEIYQSGVFWMGKYEH